MNEERRKQREREDLVDAMGEAHRAHEAAVQAVVAAPDDKEARRALEAARKAVCDAVWAYHEAKLRGREDAALTAKVGA